MMNGRQVENFVDDHSRTADDRAPGSFKSHLPLKNPRIVRVSRIFGGKDRHSKVTTVKGLRDRRIRLSVPTAIQLYDLQDKLGFNQPSKVVDWLIDAAQHEINKLPPLQVPPGSFLQFSEMVHPERLCSLSYNADNYHAFAEKRLKMDLLTGMQDQGIVFKGDDAHGESNVGSQGRTVPENGSTLETQITSLPSSSSTVPFTCYNQHESSNACMWYSGINQPSRLPETFHPIQMFPSAFNSKLQYGQSIMPPMQLQNNQVPASDTFHISQFQNHVNAASSSQFGHPSDARCMR